MKKKLFHIACRYHIVELLLASILKETMGMCSGPDIAIFKRFQQQWPFVEC